MILDRALGYRSMVVGGFDRDDDRSGFGLSIDADGGGIRSN
jgi:hypothetical protein